MTVILNDRAFAMPARWKQPFDLGFSVIPLKPRDKRASVKWEAYQANRASLEQVRRWAAREDSNIGIVTGAISGLVVLDLDSADAVKEADGLGIPDTITARTGKGMHVYFQHPGGTIGNRTGLRSGWDIRGDGGYVVAPGSVHPNGSTYEWENPPGLFELAPLPDWLANMLEEPTHKPRDAANNNQGGGSAWAEAALRNELADLANAPEGQRNAALNKAAFSLAQIVAGGHLDEGEVKRRMHATAAAIGLDADEIAPTIESGFKDGSTQPRHPPERDHKPRRDSHDPETGEVFTDSGRRPKRDKEPSEDDIALAFTARHGQTLRFDHNAGAWFEWDGTRWKKDNCHRAFTYARQMGRQHGAAGKANFAGGVEKFARADPVHAVTSEIWDSDPFMLGTPGGTVDLRTGDYSEARPGDYITKLTGVAPEHGEPTRWLQFLDDATAGDRDLMRFLQQMAGYCLTGATSEHALFFIYGPGGNGKSVFLNILNSILGDYATTAGMDTFTASKSDRHPTDLAMLKGARLVSASETEEGRAWAESRIKQMTGGDKISARFMRQDFFEFVPAFKLVIVGNHAPVLANVDDAARRRFNIIPFTHKPARPDPMLEQKLKEETPRILAWAIAGCMDWQRNRLVRPEIVTAATQDYFDDQDLFGQWIAERCERGKGKFDATVTLYNSWAEYARAAGDDPGSQRAMSSKLKKAGFPYRNANSIRAFHGIAVKPQGAFHG